MSQPRNNFSILLSNIMATCNIETVRDELSDSHLILILEALAFSLEVCIYQIAFPKSRCNTMKNACHTCVNDGNRAGSLFIEHESCITEKNYAYQLFFLKTEITIHTLTQNDVATLNFIICF